MQACGLHCACTHGLTISSSGCQRVRQPCDACKASLWGCNLPERWHDDMVRRLSFANASFVCALEHCITSHVYYHNDRVPKHAILELSMRMHRASQSRTSPSYTSCHTRDTQRNVQQITATLNSFGPFQPSNDLCPDMHTCHTTVCYIT